MCLGKQALTKLTSEGFEALHPQHDLKCLLLQLKTRGPETILPLLRGGCYLNIDCAIEFQCTRGMLRLALNRFRLAYH
jgi:hypothetical protein